MTHSAVSLKPHAARAVSMQQQQHPQRTMSLTKTCQNCFQAKIRCDRTQNRDACDRCHRLRKHCVFRPSTRRYNSAMRDARIEALEAQVRDLLGGRASSSAGNSLSPEPQPVSSSNLNEDVIDAGLVSAAQADVLVEIFRMRMTPHFPFVVVPAHVSAAQLRIERPFLFLAVLAVTSFDDSSVQRQLGQRLKQAVSELILSIGALTFDVLQGLLVYLAWSHYHARPRLYSQYLQLAVSIVIDLRLDRSPPAAWKTNVGSQRNPHAEPAPPLRSAEEQRAAAGCFYLCSTIAKLLQKLNTMPYSDYIAECCLSLANHPEAPTDKYLYHIVQLQHIMESTDFLSAQQQQPVGGDDPTTQAAVHAVRTELSAFRANLPFELSENQSLLMQYHTAELFLYQSALVDWSMLSLPSSSSSDPTPSSSAANGSSSPLHLEVLCAGLSASKSLLDAYLSLPARAETAFNNSEWIQLSFGLTVAARLAVASTTLVVVDRSSVEQQQIVSTMSQLRAALSMSNALRALAQRIGALASAMSQGTTEMQQGDNVFAQYEQRVRRIKQWFDVYSAPARREQLQQLSGGGGGGSGGSRSSSHCRSRSASSSPSLHEMQQHQHQQANSSSATRHHHRPHAESTASSSSYLQPHAADSLPIGLDFASEPHQIQHHHPSVGSVSYPGPDVSVANNGAAPQHHQTLLPDLPLDFLLGDGSSANSVPQGCGGAGDWLYPAGGPDWLV
ncbi:hypothetical protein DBV05_g8648 [Lasiodiplodia theobromae]|uniref:Zn(2)-C6 fungal-type domain-containing protein n=1 Tax=Lasiodiplodia theobromae TaxID=45133 RepID=A0A5N5D4N5_9PEZI|nr:hypothetical protein DBV05_g8648 [Lasiodiplodia theobromae]